MRPPSFHQLMQAANLIRNLKREQWQTLRQHRAEGRTGGGGQLGVPPGIRHLSEFTSTPRHQRQSNSEKVFSGLRVSLGCWSRSE